MKLILKTILLIAELLAFTLSASGGVGVERLIVVRENGERWYGTAVSFGPGMPRQVGDEYKWAFVTAKHNVEGIDTRSDKVFISVLNEWERVVTFDRHPTEDVAVVGVLSEHQSVPHPTLAETLNGSLTLDAFPGDGKRRVQRSGSWDGGDIALVPDGIYRGDSGGGLFNSDGRLLGVAVGYENGDHSRVVTVTCHRIRAWYQQRGWPCPSCPVEKPPVISVPVIPQGTPPSSSVAGPPGPPGPRGPQGEKGEPGPPGTSETAVGVSRLWLDGNTLYAEYSNGNTASVGTIDVPAGCQCGGGCQCDVEAMVAAVLERLDTEVAGKAGPPGTVNVVIQDSGRQVGRHDDLESGSTVLVDINRFKRDSKE